MELEGDHEESAGILAPRLLNSFRAEGNRVGGDTGDHQGMLHCAL
jgi:hypothetical protein